MKPEIDSLANKLYNIYNEATTWSLPSWEALEEHQRTVWRVIANGALPELKLDDRESEQIAHALDYAENHSKAGVPGHGQFLLVAKLARALGLR